VGACALAPLVVVDKKAHGRQTPNSLKKVVDEVRSPQQKPIAKKAEPVKKPAPKKKPVKKKPAKKKPVKKKASKKKPAKRAK
jgi:hypothetical protein